MNAVMARKHTVHFDGSDRGLGDYLLLLLCPPALSRRQLWGTGVCAPSTSNNFILVHFGVNLTANYTQILCSMQDQLVQMSTTHIALFDQYCKTISHRAAAAPGPEIRRECPKTYFPATPLLATNAGDATAPAVIRESLISAFTVITAYFR